MGLTKIRVVLGQKVDKHRVFPGGLKNNGWGRWGLGRDGTPFDFELEQAIIHGKPIDSHCPIQTVLAMDYAPYKQALGDEVILGVILHSNGDGYADITHLFTTNASTYEARRKEVEKQLRDRNLPHDEIRIWIVATPDI